MLNQVALMGRLTRDPELRRTGSGIATTTITLAVERDFKNAETGEFVTNNFSKGRMAAVTGRLQIRNWQDKDGNKRRTAEVVADSVYFADSKPAAPAQGTVNSYEELYEPDPDLPF